MRLAPLAFALVAGACSAPTTAVVVDISLRAGDPTPTTVLASVFDGHHALTEARPLTDPTLPGQLVFTGLPATAETLRIALDGGPSFVAAGLTVTLRPHATTHVAAVLSADTLDSDGDGVPESIDDCPFDPNPDQTSSNGVVGDACAGIPDLAVPGPPADMAAPAAPASACPISGTRLCEGWDEPTLPGIWHAAIDPAVQSTIAPDNVHVFRGPTALHLHTDALAGGTYTQVELSETTTFPLPTMFVRTYVYLPSATEPFDATLLQLYQSDAPYSYALLALDDGGHLQFVDTDPPTQTLRANSALPTDRWVCVEWAFQQAPSDMGSGTTDVWIDGVEVPELHSTMVLAWPGYKQFALANDNNAGSAKPFGTDVWFDELAIGPTRIGCE